MPSSSADPTREKQLRMLRALDEAAAKLEALENARTEPIAIIGGGCRFPGGVRDLATYWQLLKNGVDATGEMPLDRWDIDALYDPNPDAPGKLCTRRGSFLPAIDRFNAEHFNISPREAASLDPQHRLLLEVAHEALDSAGQLNDRLVANLTGVFIGVTNNDYAHLLREHQTERPLDAYFVTGNAPNSAAGRISYQLGLRGPSLVLDTACSSSLATVQLACQSLRARECHLALAGGVNLLVLPDSYAALSRAHMLAPDGRCKTFDAAADGYGRGEGGGIIVLKRLSDACRDGDTILATIRGGAINHDGPSSGFTVPSGAAQRTLLQQALSASRLAPTDIDYVEAHGTGTTLGDPIEVNALVDVLGAGRTATNPLLLGSVKTNIGHLESAAGIAGILKVVLSLWHRQLPRHLHFQTPSPRIPWADIPVKVTDRHEAWPDHGHARCAGISSFGVSGTNVHLMLEESPLDLTARKTLPSPRKAFGDGPRYWAFDRPPLAAIDGWLHRVEWQPRPRRERATTPVDFDPAAAAAAVATWAANAAPSYADEAYRNVLPALEQLAAVYAAAAVTVLKAGAGVVPAHARLWSRIQVLATDVDSSRSAADQASRLLAVQPDAAIEIKLLQRCGEALPAVLRGEVDPLSLLFPTDVSPTAADLYGHNPVSRALNDLIATWLAAAVPNDRPLRVLEIGGGTGSTTKTVLAALAGCELDYVFTDVSPLFFAQAKTRFADNAAVTCRLLDIERNPLDQGFAPGEFDLIVGANVVHATQDLATTLAYSRRLLAGGGQLALIELTSPLGFLDLIFGLTDGWWRFTDTTLRPQHPLLNPSQWKALLPRHGFTDAQSHQLPVSAGEIFHQQALITACAEGPTPILPRVDGRWLLIGPAPETLTAKLQSLGADVVQTSAQQLSPLRHDGPWAGVVSFATSTATSTDLTPLRESLAIAHALIESPAPWWIVTRGAVETGDAPPDWSHLAGAGLWGFARTVAQEHPELDLRRIDLMANVTDDEVVALVAEFAGPDLEDQLALRGRQRFAARLIAAAATTASDALPISEHGSILIVGGLGGLGLSLAQWLGEQGARHLTLASRSAPTASTQAEISRLQARGLTIHTRQLDVTSSADVARVLAEIATVGPPLRGVVHAAGVLDDGSLRQLEWSRFPAVLDPKITGAWHLHEQTRELPLDFFLLFSSSTALLGTPGQANHAAANAWLDALAHRRRAAGLPAVSINWGPWSDIGAAARRQVTDHARRHGLGTISPTKGWHALGAIMRSLWAQVAVLPVTWSEAPPSLTRSAFFDAVRQKAITPATVSLADPSPAAAVDWAAWPATTRVTRLRELVCTELAAVLGLANDVRIDPAKGFFSLGMDSLTAVELRNRLQNQLGRNVPSTLVFDHPTADGLSRHLADLFRATSPSASTPPPSPTETPAIDNLSEAELSVLLDEELKGL